MFAVIRTVQGNHGLVTGAFEPQPMMAVELSDLLAPAMDKIRA